VRVSLARTTSAEATLRFEVTDTGPGIPRDAQARLFEPFTQSDGSSARRHGGAGLGLAICRRLAEGMRGELGWRTTAGRGSTFWLVVPLARAAPAGAEPGSAPLGRVLVVEDNRINQRVAVAMLETLGYAADTVENGLEALEACEKTRYDAILMDCQMPEMDGFRATAFLREREGSSRHTPIIAVTASVRAQDREQCLSAGMDDHLAKPVALETLADTLRRWISPREGTAAPRRELSPEHPLRVLEAQTGPRVYAEVLEVFLQSTPRRLEEMHEAVERGDAAALRALTHSVKGAAAQLGLQAMADLCGQVEVLAEEPSLTGAQRALASLDRDYRAVRTVLEQELRRLGVRAPDRS
jgi:CheY-like chemotaxis protein/HPt (histidine-containing phosphotransfer) domain-containing protein